MPRTRDDIRREIAREEARLAEIDRAREEVTSRIVALKRDLGATRSSEPLLLEGARERGAVPKTARRKVELFQSLFGGRPDVFATRFVSRKTGRSGYSPACSNKWEPGICPLRTGGKCGECANQAFLPLSDRVVLEHLQGRHVVGVYPLLADERCWFLAADFDKSVWKDDVTAFRETCESLGVPVAIERSRSGDGAHAWFFFETPVAANVARAMGCYLLTETMNRRHQLSMESYDRLFPNQNTMPQGGFGNLIALPLQYEPRREGNSVFVDGSFTPYKDQWAFLAAVPRIEATVVEDIAEEATRTGQILGVRSADPADVDTAKPWARPPSGRRAIRGVSEPIPREIRGVLAQRLFIEKMGLPSGLIAQLKRLGAFQNPEFYKKQQMRLSTVLTPRVISCVEELPLFLAVPRGCVADARSLIADCGATLEIEDQREAGIAVDAAFKGELTALQSAAARAMLAHDAGVFVGPPGIGKTVLGTYLIAQRARSTLILVHRKPLLEQWIAQIALFLGLAGKEIGQIGGGKRRPNGRLDVAMIQSLVRKGVVDDLVAGYGHVIVDECHHIPAVSFERVLSEVKARFVVGLTATPQRRDGHHPIIEMQLGPVRYRADVKSQAANRTFEHKLIVRETPFRLMETHADAGIQEIYGALSRDASRNRRILDDVMAVLAEGRSPILLSERKDHVEYFEEALRGLVRHIVVLRGGMSAKQRREAAAQLSEIPDDEERLILATGRYIGEGFDDARLDTLFLTMPVSWKGTLIQYCGRLNRHHPRKREVRIYDYVDREVPMLVRMFGKRLRTYQAIGYRREE
ncbi:MAG TPA: DEAD/DEAH box helicase family protein [Gammaproteobacteria bacterium]|nr:DEAD/DEAH box helicase family protein [Gammaproteobacteria bacterium]